MTLTDDILKVLREQGAPLHRQDIFALANEAESADDVSRALYWLHKKGAVARYPAEKGFIWSIADPALRKPDPLPHPDEYANPQGPQDKSIGQRFKEALGGKRDPAVLRPSHVPPAPIPQPRPLDPPPGPKHTPAPKPILPPSAKPMPTGKLGYSIHDGGALTIYLNDGMSDPLELDADETLALGDFLHATQGLWRP